MVPIAFAYLKNGSHDGPPWRARRRVAFRELLNSSFFECRANVGRMVVILTPSRLRPAVRSLIDKITPLAKPQHRTTATPETIGAII